MTSPPPLSTLTTLRAGGPPRRLVAVREEDVLADELRKAADSGWPVLILGGGSNLLVADRGFPGTALRLEDEGLELRSDGNALRVTAAAGCAWDRLVAATVEAGSFALAPLSGIPGSCGAAPIQNIGAYGVELSQHLVAVRLYDRMIEKTCDMPAKELELSYRDSRLKSRDAGRYVVLSIELALPLAGEAPLRYAELRDRAAEKGASTPAALREVVLDIRRGKSMVLDLLDPDSRSAGSFFTNPIVSTGQADALATLAEDAMPQWPTPDGRVKLSAAWCIERAGFRRGERRGAAALSRRHVLALCNPEGAASAAELLAFAREIHERVRDELGIVLEPEPRLIGFSDEELGPLCRTTPSAN